MSSPSPDNITDVLRNSLPGYVMLFILFPLLADLKASFGDAFTTAVFVTGGPIIGLLLFNVYLAVYRNAVWGSRRLRNWLDLDHVSKLMSSFPTKSKDDIRAIWDHVFFTLDPQISRRLLFLYSRAHAWALIAMSLAIGSGYWYWFRASAVISIFLLGMAIVLFVLPYPLAVRQGASLESVLVSLNWGHIEAEAEELGWATATSAESETGPFTSLVKSHPEMSENELNVIFGSLGDSHSPLWLFVFGLLVGGGGTGLLSRAAEILIIPLGLNTSLWSQVYVVSVVGIWLALLWIVVRLYRANPSKVRQYRVENYLAALQMIRKKTFDKSLPFRAD